MPRRRRFPQTPTTTCSSIYPSTSLFADRDHHMFEHVASRVAVTDVATDMFEHVASRVALADVATDMFEQACRAVGQSGRHDSNAALSSTFLDVAA
jgi:hypothetical protein